MGESKHFALKLNMCYGCKIMGRDLLLATYNGLKRCPLCGRLCEEFDPESTEEETSKGHYTGPKDVIRFPRLLHMTDDEKKVIDLINERCRDFDCPGKVIDVRKGPVVTQYKFQPDRFTRVKKIKSINEDLAMSLAVENVSMTRLPGEACVGIYIPNKERKTVTFSETLKNVIAHRDDMELPINFGTTSTGEPYVEDLTKLPHLLIAGATGAGKSVFLNNVIASLMAIRSPKQLQFIMSDPKSVDRDRKSKHA